VLARQRPKLGLQMGLYQKVVARSILNKTTTTSQKKKTIMSEHLEKNHVRIVPISMLSCVVATKQMHTDDPNFDKLQ
jgi:hypothetical protein